MECVAYIRVSTERQAEEGYGLESQKRDIDEYCRKHQLIIKEYYVDAGLSGMEMSKRVELQRLISDMAKIDVIVVYKLDRLARDTVDALYMIEKIFTPKGICVESVHDFARYVTPQDKFQTQVMAAVAEYDRNTMMLRMRGGMLERVKRGFWMGGGNLPFCYSYDKELGILVPIPERAETARNALELYINGYSDGHIARICHYSGEPVAKKILTSVVNIGMIPYKGKVYQGKHEPIFDIERYELAQEIRKSRHDAKSWIAHPTNLLTGLCYCGVCGCAMRYQKWGQKEDSPRKIYCCSKNIDLDYLPNYNHACDSKPQWATDIEKQVEEQMLEISVNLSKYKPKEKETKLQMMQSQLSREKNKLKRLYVLYAEGNDTVIELIKQAEEEVKRITVAIEEESKTAKNTQKKEFVYDNIKKLADVWDKIDKQSKNKILKTIISKIVIVNDNIEIQLKNF